MVTEFVLYVVLINAQRSLPVITKGVEVSFDLFFFFFFPGYFRVDGPRPGRKCVMARLGFYPTKEGAF